MSDPARRRLLILTLVRLIGVAIGCTGLWVMTRTGGGRPMIGLGAPLVLLGFGTMLLGPRLLLRRWR